MTNHFEEIAAKSLNENVFKAFDDEWALITAGKEDSFNTMTASWGTMGILWNKPVAIIFIRPHRYTLKFIEENQFFTISFFTNEYKHILNYCGQHSGKEVDKMKETGLTPIFSNAGSVGFEEARLMIECHKIYTDEFKPDRFINKEILHRTYPNKDYHHIFVGEIEHCYIAKPESK